MNKTAVLFLSVWMFIATACSWVDDDYSNCPDGSWLKIVYTYNMLDVDAASTQVDEVTLFILDEHGNLVSQKEVGSLELQQNQYRVRLPELPDGQYSILVWGGLADSRYNYTPTKLVLGRDEKGTQGGELASLFHGRIEKVTIDNAYREYEVSLTKDTNVFSCIIQCLSKKELNPEDFRLEILAFNGSIDHWNTPITEDMPVCYLPFLTQSADLEGLQTVVMGLNTLRLMENDNSRMRLTYVPEEKVLIDFPLSKYLILSSQVNYPNMPAQEYLDREDRYNLLFFMNETDDKSYSVQDLEVCNWIVHIQDVVFD